MALIEHIKNIDDGLYDHMESLDNVTFGIRSLTKEIKRQGKEQRKILDKTNKRYKKIEQEITRIQPPTSK